MQNTISYQQQISFGITRTIAKKEAYKKIAIFSAILACFILAVNI